MVLGQVFFFRIQAINIKSRAIHTERVYKTLYRRNILRFFSPVLSPRLSSLPQPCLLSPPRRYCLCASRPRLFSSSPRLLSPLQPHRLTTSHSTTSPLLSCRFVARVLQRQRKEKRLWVRRERDKRKREFGSFIIRVNESFHQPIKGPVTVFMYKEHYRKGCAICTETFLQNAYKDKISQEISDISSVK